MVDMHYIDVAPARMIRKDAAWFTYASDEPLAPGMIVTVPVGKSSALGVVLRAVAKPAFATRSILSVVHPTPLPMALLQTVQWMSSYYQTHLSLVLSSVLPRGILTQRRARRAAVPFRPIRTHGNQTPTPEQAAVIADILSSSSPTQLLHGVTGSGKTLVYKKCVQKLLAQGQSSIVLVPEIALTSQIVDEFTSEFGERVIVTHSQQTEATRHIIWKRVLESTEPLVVIGPRSALFLPLAHIGLIVVDEFHEPSYKQEQSPRYSALRVATMIAKYHQGRAVFGSATPPVAEYFIAAHSEAPVLRLSATARQTTPPTTTIVAMTKRGNFTQHRFLSDALLQAMTETLDQGRQVLLFHNRRGTTATTLCSDCGWIAVDPDTDIPLTLHADLHLLVSHISGFTTSVPTSCPICGGTDIVHKGIGTKLLESEVRRLFPNKNIVRFDGDGAADETVEQRYKDLYDGAIDIIIGTQVIAKGIDLPHLETVGVVQADAGLSLPDYTSSERTFQLLAQVVGRVGRRDTATQVIIQSYQPSHIAIAAGGAQNYTAFYKWAIQERKRSHFPPFCYLLQLTCTYKTEKAAITNARKLRHALQAVAHTDVTFLGPAPAFYEKARGSYRWQITAKSPIRAHLSELIPHLPPKYWQYELDPMNLL
jgi:primosomal protein N' (replication factor Y)